MATSFGNIKRQIIVLMKDVEQGGDYGVPIFGSETSAESLFFAVQAALTAIAQRVWRKATLDLEGGNSEYELPEDVIDIEGVLDLESNLFLSHQEISVEQFKDSTGMSWIDFPEGTLTFSTELSSAGARVFYSSNWVLPEDSVDDDPMPTPQKLDFAIALFGASFCSLSRAAGASNIRQFNTKVDSGTPIDNPWEDMAKFFLARFEAEMSRFPQMRKGSS